MKNIPNREIKIFYLNKHYMRKISGPIMFLLREYLIWYENKNIYIKMGDELHHRCPDCKTMRQSCPDAIHSMLNLIPLEHNFHMDNKGFMALKKERIEKMQAFLTSTGRNEFGNHWNGYGYLFFRVNGVIKKSPHPYYPDPNKKPIHKALNDFVNGRTARIMWPDHIVEVN